jgi:signal transduction histidine kinase/CheY-like chemotaxis protein
MSIKDASKKHRQQYELSYRIIAYMALFSALFAIVGTAYHLYGEYRRDIQTVDDSLSYIEEGYLDALSIALWEMNEQQLATQLDSTLFLPYISFAEVVEVRGDLSKPISSVGKRVTSPADLHEFNLLHSVGSKVKKIGSLRVAIDRAGINAHLREEAMLSFAPVAIQVFLWSLVAFIVFQHLIMKHLYRTANYMDRLDFNNLGVPFRLVRGKLQGSPSDALGRVVTSINLMRVNLLDQVAERDKAEKAIRSLVESTVGTMGQESFEKIVRELCSWLDADGAFLAEIKDSTARTLAMVLDGRNIPEYEYSIKGSPCAEAVNKGYLVCPARVTSQFPDDKGLAEMNIEGYVCIPIRDKEDVVIGILAALSRKEMHEEKSWRDVFQITAAKLSSEMERKKAEARKEELESQLRQSQKMEAVGTMAGGIAHDFNNILAIIIGNAELALSTLSEDSPVRSELDDILSASHRAKDIVKQMLAFSRPTKGEKKPYYLCRLVEENMKTLRAAIPTTVETTVHIPSKCHENISDCRMVLVDPTQIHQLLLNLCGNAVQAMEEKGHLRVSLSEITVAAGEEDRHPGLDPDIYECLSVSDTGGGMDERTVQSIFDPFFTTKEPGVGTGMGLSIVHSIVESHGARIFVESEPGKGTVFHVYFPSLPPGSPIQDGESELLPKGSERILFVDDEASLTRVGSKMLRVLGYTVTTCAGSGEALDTFRAGPDEIDAVITDQTMPAMTGAELAGEILKIRSDVPVLLCTGYSNLITEEKAKSIGIRKICMKPLSMETLARSLREVLDEKGP